MLPALGDALCAQCHDDIIKHIAAAEFPHQASEAGCYSCHDPHGNGNVLMLSEPAQSFCVGCHADVARALAGNKYSHQPVAEGECWGCHDPHGSAQRLLLKGTYPENLYTGFSEDKYQLCFGCHDPQAFTLVRSSGLTGFRNGYTNLHALHVNKAIKGRSCQACHGVHGAKQQKLIISEAAGFGRWKIPVKFQLSENGGNCTVGCHKPKTYDRVNPVTY